MFIISYWTHIRCKVVSSWILLLRVKAIMQHTSCSYCSEHCIISHCLSNYSMRDESTDLSNASSCLLFIRRVIITLSEWNWRIYDCWEIPKNVCLMMHLPNAFILVCLTISLGCMHMLYSLILLGLNIFISIWS